MTLRNATPTDWPQIQTLLQTLQLPLQGAESHLQHYRIMEHNGEVIATGGLEVYGEHALLRSMAVQHNHQHTGLGGTLIRDLIQHAQDLQVKDLYLLTTTAATYFLRFGFQRITRNQLPEALQASRELQGACPESAVVMHKKLI